MSTVKHEKTAAKDAPRDDLEENPGIGQSPGLFATGADPNELAGDNTMEGDVENEAGLGDGADERHVGRTNE